MFLSQFFKSKFCAGLIALLGITQFLAGSDGLDQLRGLNVSHVKIPFYHKQQLQAMIFSMHASNSAQNLIGDDVIIELLRKNADADNIKDSWSLPLYQLKSPLLHLLKFWRPRFIYSQGVIKTAKAEIDRQEHIASGSKPVYFRSPLLDMNGVGFLANFKKQTVRINSDVKIVLRSGKLKEYGFQGGKIPTKYNYIYATSDAMHLDFGQKQIILVGNVHVYENRFMLTCDRLTIFLKDKKQKQSAVSGDISENLGNTGISRFFADGEVVITRVQKPAPPRGEEQKVYADHLLYDIATEKILLTGDQANPRMVNGTKQLLSGREITLFRKRNQMIINGECHLEDRGRDAQGKLQLRTIDSDYGNFDVPKNVNDFLGNVKVKDSQMKLFCDQMRVILHQTPNTSVKKPAPDSNPLEGLGDMSTLKSGHRELDRIICRSNVVVETVSTATDPVSRLTSDHANLNYRQDLLTFTSNVKLRHVSGKLDCNKLWLFLQDKKKAQSGRVTGVEARSGKTLRQAIAMGQVHMVDDKSTLDTDQLTLHFIPAPAGQAAAPGMLQSGDLRVSRIYCDGNMVAVNYGKKAVNKAKTHPAGVLGALGKSSGKKTIKAQHSLTDMLKNYSEFHELVSVEDESGTLNCEDLYVYAKKQQTATPQKTSTVDDEDPDADPFALTVEDSAPTQVVLAQGVELEKVICRNNVKLNRKDNSGKKQQIGGEYGKYVVADKTIVVTGTPEKRPYLQYDNRRQKCDKIILHMENEQLETIGKTDTITLSKETKNVKLKQETALLEKKEKKYEKAEKQLEDFNNVCIVKAEDSNERNCQR